MNLVYIKKKNIIKPHIEVPQNLFIDYSVVNSYLRPACITDLEMINIWFQNEIVSCMVDKRGRDTWDGVLKWWVDLRGENLVFMFNVIEPRNPLCYFVGRTVGMVEFYDWYSEYPEMYITLGDPKLFGCGMGYRILNLAMEQRERLKLPNGDDLSLKFRAFVNKENEPVFRIMDNESARGNIVKYKEMEGGTEIRYERKK